MIRSATRDDLDGILALAVASGLFGPPELPELSGVLADYFGGDPSRAHFWLVDDDGGLASAAYCAPEIMTDGTWNLLFIAVHRALQGQGRGAALLRHTERTLTERGGRLLLVETSGTDALARTCLFYRKQGFDEEARIREYYGPGDDKIIFRKMLNA